ncbi:hypothetical protein E1B28_010545 [Marasmius oreades]|uniref:Uncharacterized protein n=1 Tax=Marasmius oreades TaxID=181124 RepID=A0A9P7UST5_9AGAR|nr:uncharacterized protein E1B28_010545 [Marasmius oreades]KAG7091516.1 hypothetical protein E1B28_010545 [Marasmius oreades]
MKHVLKIQKRTQSAEIVPGFGDRRFTVISLEPENEKDVEKIWTVLEPFYETALAQRRVWLTQLFGVGRSMTPTLIYHDEVVNGQTIMDQYKSTPIVSTYLLCRFLNSFSDVQDDGTMRKLTIPLSTGFRDWTFNLRTGSFQYDVINTALSGGSPGSYLDRPRPLPPDCNPPLASNEILRAVPDFLRIVSTFTGMSGQNFRLLTFGTVIDVTKPGILAYFPYISSPVWSCRSVFNTPDILAKYSKSVPSLVDLTFVKNKNKWELAIQFSLRLPEERLQAAFLAQSFPFYKDHAKHLVFVDGLDFSLTGTFTSDPSSCDPPKYLHVPPLSPKWINNIPCLRFQSSKTRLFYWSLDRSGRMEIAEEDWKKYGVPNLKVWSFYGSRWEERDYKAVQEYLHLKKYDLGGQQFANDHGYPILVKGDPHIQPKSKTQAVVSRLGEKAAAPNMCKPIKDSFGKKWKGKQLKADESNSQINVQAGRIGQASIVEDSD